MHIMKKIIPLSSRSSEILLTDKYLIVKGGHYEIVNGYPKYTKETKTLECRDILSAKDITMRSKYLLKVFLILCAIFFSSGTIFRILSYAMKITDKQWDMLESIYTVFIKNEQGMNLLMLVAFIFVSCIIAIMICLIFYVVMPYRFFVISSIGQTIAIKRKHYDRQELKEIEHFLNTF